MDYSEILNDTIRLIAEGYSRPYNKIICIIFSGYRSSVLRKSVTANSYYLDYLIPEYLIWKTYSLALM